MSRKRIVEQLTENGINYGKISSPTDLMEIQNFAQDYTKSLIADFLTSTDEIDISGFSANPVAMNLQISSGRIYFNGLQYDGSQTNFQLTPANPTHPRIDIVYATTQTEAPANQQLTTFQRLRTNAELNANLPAYLPQQFNVHLEKRNLVNLAIKVGTASANPTAPTLEAHEIPLWRINVPANATSITGQNLVDLRRLAVNLRGLKTQLDSMLGTLGTVQTNVATALAFYLINVNWSPVYGFDKIDSLMNILSEMNQRLLVLRYRYPTIVSGDGRILATAGTDSGNPIIDVPIGQLIQFGDKYVYLQQANFGGLNANLVNGSGSTYSHPALDGIPTNISNAGSVMRIPAPNVIKWLYINHAGQMSWTTTAEPSTATDCLLLKYDPNGSTKLTRYYNLRNGLITKQGVASASAESKQFVYDIAHPPGIGLLKTYGIKASDNTMYALQPLSITTFDAPVNVVGVANGDTWVVEWCIPSAL